MRTPSSHEALKIPTSIASAVFVEWIQKRGSINLTYTDWNQTRLWFCKADSESLNSRHRYLQYNFRGPRFQRKHNLKLPQLSANFQRFNTFIILINVHETWKLIMWTLKGQSNFKFYFETSLPFSGSRSARDGTIRPKINLYSREH